MPKKKTIRRKPPVALGKDKYAVAPKPNPFRKDSARAILEGQDKVRQVMRQIGLQV